MFPTLYVSLSYLLYYFFLLLYILKVIRIQGITLVKTFETFCININSDEHVKKITVMNMLIYALAYINSDEHV